MKKIFLVIMFFVGSSITYAFDWNYSEWSEEYPQGMDEILIQSEDRYLWYKETIYDIEYLKKEDINDKLYDENDIQYYESEELLEYPEEYLEREISKIVKQIVYTKSDIAGISLKTSSSNISISEITIIKNDVEIINYNTSFSYLNDGNLDEYISLDDEVNLYFNNKVDLDELDNLHISVYYNKNTSGQEGIDFNFISDANDIIYYVNYKIDLCQTQNCTLNPRKNILMDSLYHSRIMYKYKDKLYKTFRVNKEYDEEYASEKEGYQKDISTKKTFYRYITNDYIILDAYGNIVTDDYYCEKSFCKAVFIKKEETVEDEKPVENDEEEITSNPKTCDPLYDFIILFITSFLAGSYFIVKKCRTIK